VTGAPRRVSAEVRTGTEDYDPRDIDARPGLHVVSSLFPSSRAFFLSAIFLHKLRATCTRVALFLTKLAGSTETASFLGIVSLDERHSVSHE